MKYGDMLALLCSLPTSKCKGYSVEQLRPIVKKGDVKQYLVELRLQNDMHKSEFYQISEVSSELENQSVTPIVEAANFKALS